MQQRRPLIRIGGRAPAGLVLMSNDKRRPDRLPALIFARGTAWAIDIRPSVTTTPRATTPNP
jgi:hypothetical protein